MAFIIKVETNEEAYALRNAMHSLALETGKVRPSDVYTMLNLNIPYDPDMEDGAFWTIAEIRHIQILKLEDTGWGLTLPVPCAHNAKTAEGPGINKEKNSDNYESKDDMVSHPPHYQSESGLEVIDVIKAFTEGLTGIVATDAGNIIKYACRWHKKNGVQDLEKILWYTQHLINELKQEDIHHE